MVKLTRNRYEEIVYLNETGEIETGGYKLFKPKNLESSRLAD